LTQGRHFNAIDSGRIGGQRYVLRTLVAVWCVEYAEALAFRRKESHDDIDTALVDDELQYLILFHTDGEAMALATCDGSLNGNPRLKRVGVTLSLG